jgi:hypothetical protein
MSAKSLSCHRIGAGRLPLNLKIEREAKSPHLWGWSICLGGRPIVVQSSGPCFRSAQEAWEAGRDAFFALGGRR